MKQLLVVLSALCVLMGCGGGGSGSGDGGESRLSPEEEAAQRDLDFREEATNRVLDRTEISCTVAQCVLADRETDINQVETGRLLHSCAYDCVPSEIDLSGDIRYFEVRPLWSRLPDGCYELERISVAEHSLPCIPTF